MASILLLLFVAVIVNISAFALTDHTVTSAFCNYTTEVNEYNCTDDRFCPTWFRCNTETNKCECGESYHGMIKCHKKTGRVAVSNCHCVTYELHTMETVAGSCYYNCENVANRTLYDRAYHPLPKDPSKVNKVLCDRFNRAGSLCGQCAYNTSPLVLSYNMTCVECPDGHKNWWKVVLAGFIPLVVFYFIMVMFNINVTSSRLHGVVLFSQAISMPAMTRIFLLALQTKPDMLRVVKATLPLYSIWNLDFFRTVIPNICLNIGTLDALALDYAIAVFPLLLILFSYFLIALYDNNNCCIVRLWTPFQKLFSLFKKNWNVRTSVIDSFATFFLLSYVKIVSVSCDMLIYTNVYHLNGGTSRRLYFDPSLPYTGKKHLPYAILAMLFLTMFVILPTGILSLYPFKFFHTEFLSCFSIQWHFLHTFVDSFQGCYKDATEPATLDCRCFSLIGLFLRLGFFVIYAETLTSIFFVYAAIACVLWGVLLTNINPFKKTVIYYPSTDLAFVMLISMFYIAILGVNIGSMESHGYLIIMNILVMSCPFITFIYILYIIFDWLFSQRKWGRQLFGKMRIMRCWTNESTTHDHTAAAS